MGTQRWGRAPHAVCPRQVLMSPSAHRLPTGHTRRHHSQHRGVLVDGHRKGCGRPGPVARSAPAPFPEASPRRPRSAPPGPRPGPAAPSPSPRGSSRRRAGPGRAEPGGSGRCGGSVRPSPPLPSAAPQARVPPRARPRYLRAGARGAGARSRPRGAGAAPHRGAAGGPRPARTGCNSGGGGAAGGRHRRRRLRPQPRSGGSCPDPRPFGQAGRPLGSDSPRPRTLPSPAPALRADPGPAASPCPDTRPRPEGRPQRGRAGAAPVPRAAGAAAPSRPQRSPAALGEGPAPRHRDPLPPSPLRAAPAPGSPGRAAAARNLRGSPRQRSGRRTRVGAGSRHQRCQKAANLRCRQRCRQSTCSTATPACRLGGETTHSCISAPTAFRGRLAPALARIRVHGMSSAVRHTTRWLSSRASSATCDIPPPHCKGCCRS